MVGVLLPVPDRVLLRSCEHCNGLDQFRVLRQRTVGMAVRAQDIGQCGGAQDEESQEQIEQFVIAVSEQSLAAEGLPQHLG